MSMQKKIAIIGMGPAGLMAAEKLLAAGFAVHMFDKMQSPARKFLLAGRGGLNLTHSEDLETFLTRYHDCPPWFLEMIREYSPHMLRQWAKDLGIETFIGSSGRVFPRAMKSSPLLRAWLARLSDARFHFKQDWFALSVEAQKGFDAVLFAMGGGSWPKLGSDGGWVAHFREKGIAVQDLSAANCGFEVAWSEIMKTKYAGLPLKNARFSAKNGQSLIGEAMITKAGIEGGAIYALSNALSKEIEAKGAATLTIDLKPDVTRFAARRPSDSFSNYLKKLGFSKAAQGLIFETNAETPKAITLQLNAPFGMDRAISSRGGVEFSEVSEDLQLKKWPRHFVAGEMLAFDAPTGGYLLQAAFASGARAAKGIEACL